MGDPREIQTIPPGLWVQIVEAPRLYVWHNDEQPLDIMVDGHGNVMLSAACIIRVGAPT